MKGLSEKFTMEQWRGTHHSNSARMRFQLSGSTTTHHMHTQQIAGPPRGPKGGGGRMEEVESSRRSEKGDRGAKVQGEH